MTEEEKRREDFGIAIKALKIRKGKLSAEDRERIHNKLMRNGRSMK